ncbi:hypothetical protein FORC77_2150 [Vibrio vulnificus]|nr:hypothetical protein FORC77_2150 [Vibrio vulnificus]
MFFLVLRQTRQIAIPSNHLIFWRTKFWTGQISQTFFSLKNGDINNLSHFKINQ